MCESISVNNKEGRIFGSQGIYKQMQGVECGKVVKGTGEVSIVRMKNSFKKLERRKKEILSRTTNLTGACSRNSEAFILAGWEGSLESKTKQGRLGQMSKKPAGFESWELELRFGEITRAAP